MNSDCDTTFITEDDMGEGYEQLLSTEELEDKLEILQRKEEKYRRRKENKTVR